MRKHTLLGLLIMFLIASAPIVFAETNCYSNSIIQEWLRERDAAARIVIQQWAKGAPMEDMASDVALVFTNEVYIRSMCRDSLEFLRQHLIIPDKEYNLKVETLPALILKYFFGFDILSPCAQSETGKQET
ncbi:MAG: hypothetical protein H8D67_19625 [Deltaproteobacteria bacterium]|nr:hypothetical protein [Deltaproteobacteria bacterium]